MAFSLFGKKPPTDGKSGSTPAKPSTAAPLRAATAVPGRLSGGVPDAFVGGPDAPGRFGNRLHKRQAGGAPSGYSYGLDRGLNSVEAVPGSEHSVASRSGLPLPGATTSQLGPTTEAAFTQIPSQLDMGEMPRRKAPLSNKDIPEALDDSALSFANGQTSEALRRIEEAIEGEDLGVWALQAWLMRFDLYEHLGLRAAFEAQAMEFATRFERSPPVWPSERKSGEDDPAATVLPTVNITGLLNAASAAPLSALRKTVDRYPGVRLDFARLQGADADGARYLLVTIQSLKRAGKMVKVGSEEQLLEHIRPRIKAGDRSGDATSWLLYLEVLELLGAQEEFERVAVEYATTFEVSPPSWQRVASKVVVTPAQSVSDDRFYLEGDVVSPCDALLADIGAHAKQYPVLVLDMSRARRLDFISCSQLTNLLGKLQSEGKGIEIRSPNEMISTLLLLMGANEIARIVPRRG